MKEKQGDNEGSWSEGGTSNGFPPSCYPIRNRGSLRSTSQGEAFPSWNRFVGETISQISLVSLFIGRKLFALESFLPLWAGEKGRGKRQLVRYANRTISSADQGTTEELPPAIFDSSWNFIVGCKIGRNVGGWRRIVQAFVYDKRGGSLKIMEGRRRRGFIFAGWIFYFSW